jgi:signal peptidase I
MTKEVLVMEIKEGFIICDSYKKQEMIKKYSTEFKSYTFLSLNDLIDRLLGKVKKKGILLLMDKYSLSYELALEYAKYIIYGTYVLTLIAIIIFVIKIGKKEFPKIKINLEKLNSVIDLIILFPLCISIATFCFTFLFTFTNVSGDSMHPNIHESYRLLVTYPSEYNRFDVVVVKVDSSYLNVRDNDLYLKRIIGLPGEYIDYRFENGITQLYVNGKKVSEDFYTEVELRKYLTYNTSYSHELFDWGEKCFTEGTDAPVKQCDKIEGHYIIPEGYYFVLGDNRLVSKDSRDIGLIKEEDIIGVTKYILNDIFKPIKID